MIISASRLQKYNKYFNKIKFVKNFLIFIEIHPNSPVKDVRISAAADGEDEVKCSPSPSRDGELQNFINKTFR